MAGLDPATQCAHVVRAGNVTASSMTAFSKNLKAAQTRGHWVAGLDPATQCAHVVRAGNVTASSMTAFSKNLKAAQTRGHWVAGSSPAMTDGGSASTTAWLSIKPATTDF